MVEDTSLVRVSCVCREYEITGVGLGLGLDGVS